jgi:hypothetical protein
MGNCPICNMPETSAHLFTCPQFLTKQVTLYNNIKIIAPYFNNQSHFTYVNVLLCFNIKEIDKPMIRKIWNQLMKYYISLNRILIFN